MFSLKKYIHGDRVIWLTVLFLSIFSVLAVYSSTGTLAYRFKAGDTEYYLLKQFRLLLTGLVIMFLVHRINFKYFSRLAQVALFISVPLLIITLLFGTSVNEASRWLTLPIGGISFQTSDFAKVALIMYVARTLAMNQNNIKDFRTAFLPVIIPVAVVCGLILPSNFSTAALLFLTCLVLMFTGRIKFKFLLMIGGIFILALSVFVTVSLFSGKEGRIGTWKNRIENFISSKNADGNYQVNQAKIAIATGGILGKGPGNSTQRNFLPQPYSDFIYAIIIEEYGFAGGVLILLLYFILLFRCIRIISKHKSVFASLMVTGCCLQLVLQAVINMAVAVNLIPVTGQSLPLVSMGGTSILFSSVAIGVILSVSRDLDELAPNAAGGSMNTQQAPVPVAVTVNANVPVNKQE